MKGRLDAARDPEDAQRAAGLLETSAAGAAALSMPHLAERVKTARARLRPAPPPD
jgi:hypothetical protein